MDEERSASREVISWDVMFVFVVRRRKSLNHWGEAWRGEVGESMEFGFERGGSSGEDCDGYGVLVVEGLSEGCVKAAEA